MAKNNAFVVDTSPVQRQLISASRRRMSPSASCLSSIASVFVGAWRQSALLLLLGSLLCTLRPDEAFRRTDPALPSSCEENGVISRRSSSFLLVSAYEITADVMQSRIDSMRMRRGHKPWMLDSHPLLKHRAEEIRAKKLPNILLILVDDLGYGDTSVAPFTSSLRPGMDWLCSETGGFLTTHLETLAQQGLRMTNMHSAAPVCSPSRASLLTGIAAWRLGALNAFELGQDLSQRNGFLAQIPTLPGALREAGYYTAHSGKWHLGGMRQEYIEARERNDVCTNPGPNQAGFEDYVSMLDGPGTPRYTLLLRDPTNLHTNGHNYFIRNDVPAPSIQSSKSTIAFTGADSSSSGSSTGAPPTQSTTVLSDREAEDAMEFIRHAHTQRPGQPWFVQLWLNAPHSPWTEVRSGSAAYEKELLKRGEKPLRGRTCPDLRGPMALGDWRPYQYKTMVASMDASIGWIMAQIRDMGLDNNTIVVFTSDNGPEAGAGSGGPYREGKRSLLEGGTRVPFIVRWPGVIPAGSKSGAWAALTDLLPTLLDAVGLPVPLKAMPRLDGVSLLQEWLRPGYISVALGHSPASNAPSSIAARRLFSSNQTSGADTPNRASSAESSRDGFVVSFDRNLSLSGQRTLRATFPPPSSLPSALHAHLNTPMRYLHSGLNHPRGRALIAELRNRTYHWRRNTEKFDQYDSREQAAVVLMGGEYKLVTTGESMCVYRMYHLRSDPKERHNIIATRQDPMPAFDKASVASRLAAQSRSGSSSGGSAVRDQGLRHSHLPPHVDACNGHNVRTAGAEGLRDIDCFFDVHVLAKIGKCDSTGTPSVACVLATGARVLTIMTNALHALRSFVANGNAAHAQYMASGRARNTCAVPVASQVSPLDFPEDAPPHDGGTAPHFIYRNVTAPGIF